MSAYAIQASVSVIIDGWTRTRQLPTFYLDKECQGIVNEHHAKSIAFDIINPLHNSDITVNMSVSFVKRMDG